MTKPTPEHNPGLSNRRVILVLIDGGGAGAAPDAGDYGDRGAHTLRHVIEANERLMLPHLYGLGLQRILALPPIGP